MRALLLTIAAVPCVAVAQTSPPMPPPAPPAVGMAPAADTLTTAEASALFLAEVATRPGVQRSASGLLWTVDQTGQGQRPTRGETVLAEYVGSLADGTEFDRSRPSEPVRLPIRGVVPGVAEALQDMRPGETRTLYIPPALAYGARGVPTRNGAYRVPPDAALVFEITLVRIVR